MKKILMIAMMALPMAAMSQAQLTKGDASATETRTRQARPNAESSVEAIYVELVVSYNEKEGQVIKSQLGNNVFDKVTDKETVMQIKELSDKAYKSVPDAMAELTAMNFKFLTSYELPNSSGKNSAHLIFEKRTLGRAVKEEMEKQNVKPATPAPAVKAK